LILEGDDAMIVGPSRLIGVDFHCDWNAMEGTQRFPSNARRVGSVSRLKRRIMHGYNDGIDSGIDRTEPV
jgi:hypothetical protein